MQVASLARGPVFSFCTSRGASLGIAVTLRLEERGLECDS